jgi:ubiquitin-conjugating enzyme E2 A
MLPATTKRLVKDYQKFMKENAMLGILAKPRDDDIMYWECIIFGPDDTEWEGGVFKLKMEFTGEYP